MRGGRLRGVVAKGGSTVGKVKLELKTNNVYTCQRIVGPFDDGCERLYSVMVKMNKRNGDKVIQLGSYLNALDHNMVKEMCGGVFLF